MSEELILIHHGIKGMRWGVRRFQNEDGSLTGAGKRRYKVDEHKTVSDAPDHLVSKTGQSVELQTMPSPRITNFLAAHNRKIRATAENSKNFKIKADGKEVGDLELFKESKDSLNVIWVGIDESERGHGYATAAMLGSIEIARRSGCRYVTLEVPGNSPDARHVYEKLGFVAQEQISSKDDVWGGLTSMRLDLDKVNGSLEHSALQHHGVKGMKWGIRRYQNKDGSLTAAGKRKYSEERDDRTARSEKRGLTANQKKALKTGAVVVGTVLAVYGGYKLSKAVDARSAAVASHVGGVFAERFAADIGAKGSGPGGNFHQRAAAGIRSRSFAKEASGYFNNQVADSIANRRGVGKLRNAINYNKLKTGKKTPFDLYDYQRMASTSVAKSGAFDRAAYEQLRRNAQTSQEAHDKWRYAALLIDAVNNGGQIPFSRLDEESSRWKTAN